MNINPTFLGYEHILVFTALQGAKEGVIKSEYSGTVRLADYRASEQFIKKCIAAWAEYMASKGIGDWPDALVSVDVADEQLVEEIFDKMAVLGYINYDLNHDIWEFSSLNRLFGFTITSEGNIPDWGILAWGVDGIGAFYASSDLDGIPFDLGVTKQQYLAQFPQHNITGSDIILVCVGSNTIPRMLQGWDPRLKDLIADIRSYIPVPPPVV